MVLCVVIGCSERDKDVSFHRIPAIIRHSDKRDFELSKKRREGFLLLFLEKMSILMLSIIEFVLDTSNSASLRKIFMILLIPTGYQHRILDTQKSEKAAKLIFLDTKELKEEPRRVHRGNKRIFCCINKQKW